MLILPAPILHVQICLNRCFVQYNIQYTSINVSRMLCVNLSVINAIQIVNLRHIFFSIISPQKIHGSQYMCNSYYPYISMCTRSALKPQSTVAFATYGKKNRDGRVHTLVFLKSIFHVKNALICNFFFT